MSDKIEAVVKVLLLVVGVLVGSTAASLISPRLPYGAYVSALIGLGLAVVVGSRYDESYVGSFGVGVGAGMVMPVVRKIPIVGGK